jgi:N utilization substance protein A
MNAKELTKAANLLVEEHGISPEVIAEALQEAYKSAYKKKFDQADNVEVKVDLDNSTISLAQVKEVIPDDGVGFDDITEIHLADAKLINPVYEIGDQIKFELPIDDFGRYSAQSAKQRFLQLIRDAEKKAILEEYVEQQHEIITARVNDFDGVNVYVSLPGGQQVTMGQRDLIGNESFEIGQPIKVLIAGVDQTARGSNPAIKISRSDPEFVKRLFEQEVPEVYDGVVVIESISREAGDRSKVAVRTNDSNIDPIGALVGPGGNRVQAVIKELRGEKIDIIEWVEDEAQYIANALNPSEVLDVVFDPEISNKVTVIVPDHQLSLAIGKRGQNARLAAKLTGFKIDIKTTTEAQNDDYLQSIIAQASQFNEGEDIYYDETTEFNDASEALNDIDLEDDNQNDGTNVPSVEDIDPEAIAEFQAALSDLNNAEVIKEFDDIEEDDENN